MTRLPRFALLALALAAAPACNKTTDDATTAANRANEEKAELREEIKDKAENAAEALDELGTEARQANNAQVIFEAQRELRVKTLVAQQSFAMLNSQTISTLAGITGITDAGRAAIAEKLVITELRVNEAGNAIQQLQQVPSENWDAYATTAKDAVVRAEEALDDAVEALDDAPRVAVPAS